MKKWRNASIIMLLLVFALSGCNNKQDDNKKTDNTKETQAINEDDYSALLPFNVSDARYMHAGQVDNLNDTVAISNGLMELSKEHFSPKTYAYRESQFLDYNALNTTLLGSASETNPNGLNPSAEAVFQTKVNGTSNELSGPRLLLDVFELDWYQGEELKGLSVSMVIRSKITKDEVQHTIDETALNSYLNVNSQKLIEYLRDTYPQVKNLPIYLTVFDISSDQDGVPGHFIQQAYCESRTVSLSSMKDQWVLFPTNVSGKADEGVNTTFTQYRNQLDELGLWENNSMIGTGRFQDEHLTELKIKVVAHAKTGAEMNAIVQILNENLSLFTSTDYRITVDISCDDTHYAVIERVKGSSKTTTIYI